MKIWFGYGSEHSSNLVIIGRFTRTVDVAQARQALDRLTELSSDEDLPGTNPTWDSPLSSRLFDLLRELNLSQLSPTDLEQFAYEYGVEEGSSELIITTEELEIQGFIKVLLDRGAKVEIYSAHEHASEHGRQTARSGDDGE